MPYIHFNPSKPDASSICTISSIIRPKFIHSAINIHENVWVLLYVDQLILLIEPTIRRSNNNLPWRKFRIGLGPKPAVLSICKSGFEYLLTLTKNSLDLPLYSSSRVSIDFLPFRNIVYDFSRRLGVALPQNEPSATWTGVSPKGSIGRTRFQSRDGGNPWAKKKPKTKQERKDKQVSLRIHAIRDVWKI